MNKKLRPPYRLLTRDSLQTQDRYRLKVKGWKNIYHANGVKKKAGVVITDEIDTETKTVGGYKERHYIMIKGTI